MRVKSAVDRWYKVLIFILIGIVIVSVVAATLTTEFSVTALLIGYAAIIAISALLLWMMFGTYYELREDCLFCRSGPFFEKIKYDRIKFLGLSENMLSSMALSINKIEIRQHGKSYITGTTMISPENREEFLLLLKARCRNLDLGEK